jgi:hypothetical protein
MPVITGAKRAEIIPNTFKRERAAPKDSELTISATQAIPIGSRVSFPTIPYATMAKMNTNRLDVKAIKSIVREARGSSTKATFFLPTRSEYRPTSRELGIAIPENNAVARPL